MSNHIDRYLPVANFIAELLGSDAEVILYDMHTGVVHHVINPMDEEMFVGSELRSLERNFMENRIYEKSDFILNYRALSKRKNKLKSATLFLRDDKHEIQAMLTVNMNVDKLVELRDMLNVLVSGNHPYDEDKGTSFYNSFDVSVEGMVSGSIREELDKYHMPPQRLSQNEKLSIVRSLDQKGVFLVKGAIAELALTLETTETTIYRYLNKLAESKKEL